MTLLKWFAVMAIGLMALGVLGHNTQYGRDLTTALQATPVPDGVDGSTTPGPSASASPTSAPTAVPVLHVNAGLLARQYDANKVMAQGYYKGRLVQTTGIATNISQDILGQYYVALKPANYDGWTSVQCYVADAAGTASAVNGQPVTIQGRVDDMTLGIIAFKDCRLVP